MTPSEVFWDTYASVAGWGLGLLTPFMVGTLFVVFVGAFVRREKRDDVEFRAREKRRETRADPKAN